MAEPKILPGLEVACCLLIEQFYENDSGLRFGECRSLEISPNWPRLPSTDRGNLALPVGKATASYYLLSTRYS